MFESIKNFFHISSGRERLFDISLEQSELLKQSDPLIENFSFQIGDQTIEMRVKKSEINKNTLLRGKQKEYRLKAYSIKVNGREVNTDEKPTFIGIGKNLEQAIATACYGVKIFIEELKQEESLPTEKLLMPKDLKQTIKVKEIKDFPKEIQDDTTIDKDNLITLEGNKKFSIEEEKSNFNLTTHLKKVPDLFRSTFGKISDIFKKEDYHV